jgi:hypothetical protein
MALVIFNKLAHREPVPQRLLIRIRIVLPRTLDLTLTLFENKLKRVINHLSGAFLLAADDLAEAPRISFFFATE